MRKRSHDRSTKFFMIAGISAAVVMMIFIWNSNAVLPTMSTYIFETPAGSLRAQDVSEQTVGTLAIVGMSILGIVSVSTAALAVNERRK